MNQQNEIAQIAYELYLKRGGRPGDPVQDWITAERIYAERKSTKLQPAQTLPVTVEKPSNGKGEAEAPKKARATNTRKAVAKPAEAVLAKPEPVVETPKPVKETRAKKTTTTKKAK